MSSLTKKSLALSSVTMSLQALLSNKARLSYAFDMLEYFGIIAECKILNKCSFKPDFGSLNALNHPPT